MELFTRLLISLPAQGFLWLIFIFAFCFFLVHFAKLALIGANTLQENPPPEKKEEPREEKKAPTPSQEPIYYIVERKTRRVKSSYKEPKEIHFK